MKRCILIILLSLLSLVICACGTKNVINEEDNLETEEATATINTKEISVNDASPNDAPPKIEGHDRNENKQANNNVVNENNETINGDNSKYKKTIVIDPGHGGSSNLEKEKQSPDSSVMKIKDGGGCRGVISNVSEATVNLQVSIKLKLLLESKGFNVVMTRIDDSRSIGNIERAEIGNKNNASLVIRIHCDSADNSSVSGATMLVPGKVGYAKDISDISMIYGKKILNTLISSVGMKNRGITVSQDMTGFNWSKVPVVLIEMGFMSNPSEDKLLVSDSYQDKLAQSLCNGILSALN